MIDHDQHYVGRIIGLCGHCTKPITEGPGGNTMNYTCGCLPRHAVMYAPSAAPSPSKEE
jgi:hypothetical protein